MFTVVVPAYNEEGSIVKVLQDVAITMKNIAYDYEIIVVNDGSIDKTVERIKESDLDVRLMEHAVNKGYGASLITGIRHSLYDNIIIVDADGTYPIEAIETIIKEYKGCEMVVGSRTGEQAHIPLIRKPVKYLLRKFAEYMTGEKIPDMNSGLRIMDKKVVLRFAGLLPKGFSFTTTITIAMLTNNYAVKFIPINYYKRTGRSKIRPIRDTLNFIQLIIRTVMYFSPLKIFIPLGIVAFVGNCISLYRDILIGNIGDTTIITFMAFLIIVAIGCLVDLIDKRM